LFEEENKVRWVGEPKYNTCPFLCHPLVRFILTMSKDEDTDDRTNLQHSGEEREAGESDSARVREPSRSDIAQAVASRLQSRGGDDSTSIDEAKRQSDHKTKIRKLINELTASVNYEKSSACLRVSWITVIIASTSPIDVPPFTNSSYIPY
jgi:hypothetical protein